MTTGKRLVKNTLTLFICQVTILFLSTIFIIYLARLLGPVNYGKYVFAFNFPIIFFVTLDFLTELSARDVARDKSQATNYLSNTLTLKIFLFPLLFFAVYSSIQLMGYPQDIAIAVYILSLYFFLQNLSASPSSIFVAHEKLGYPTVSAVIEKFIIVSLALAILFAGGTLTTFVWAFVIGGILRFFILGGLVRRYAKLRLRIDLSLCRYLFKSGYPILISSFFVILLSKVGIVFLSKMKGDQPVGLYGVGYGLYIMVAIIATSFTGSLFPLFSKYSQHAHGKAISLYKISLRLLFAIAVLVMVGVLALANRIILLFFKEAYIGSVAVLKIIFLALPLFFVRNLLATILFSINRQRQIMFCLGISLLFNLVLCVLLIPNLSYIGASIAFAISEVVVFSTFFYLTSRYFFRLDLLGILLKVSIAGFITYLFLFYFRQFNLFLIAVVGTVIFVGLLILVRLFSREHIGIIKESIFSEP